MKIICVGRNYADHARELGNDTPAEPVIFMKPETAIIPKRNPFFIPGFSEDVHYEAELVLRINKPGKNIQARFARKYYDEVTVGIDFTARDVQARLKEQGLPWEKAKAFDGSAAVGKFLSISNLQAPERINFRLTVNDEEKQNGDSSQMLFNFDQLIEHISTWFTLKIGDLIYTGTPAGVGRVKKNDRLELYLEENKVLSLNVK